ncbi:flippase, partial [Escherichia coli]|nr:flippase [Escherichia coli]
MKCRVKITINLGRVAKLNKIVSKSEIRNVIHNAGYMMITRIALYVAPLFILSYLL